MAFISEPRHRERPLSDAQERAIQKALDSGKITRAEAGAIHAAAMYGPVGESKRAREALAGAKVVKDR